MTERAGRWMGSGLVAAMLLPAPLWAQPPAPVVPGGADGAPVAVQMPDLPAPGEVLDDAEVDRRLREVEAEIEMLGGSGPAADGVPLHPGWPDLRALAELPPIRNVRHPRNQSVPVLTATLRHTTIQLADDESIVDFVVGDSVYFDVRGADNVAFVKAMALGRRTRLSLVTASNRTYSFDVFATEAHRPDEVLVVDWWAGGDEGEGDNGEGPSLVPGFDPDGLVLDFAPAGVVAGYEAQIRAAEQDVRRIEEDAAREEIRIRELGSRRFGEYLRAYPRRVQMRYRLSEEARAAPLLLTQIWTDGQFTYLRSRSEESPALYSLTGNEGEEPVFVNYTLSPNGLYVVDHVLGAGFAQLQGARGEWHLWDTPPLSLLTEVALPRGGDGPRWVETRSSRPFVRRRGKLLAWVGVAAVGAVVTLRVVR